MEFKVENMKRSASEIGEQNHSQEGKKNVHDRWHSRGDDKVTTKIPRNDTAYRTSNRSLRNQHRHVKKE